MSFFISDHGYIRPIISPEPNFRAGNAQFFDPDPACLIQIRPLLKADYGHWGADRNGNTILYACGVGGESEYVCYVRLPPHRLKNNRIGVLEAIKRVKRYDRAVAAKLLLIASKSKWSSL